MTLSDALWDTILILLDVNIRFSYKLVVDFGERLPYMPMARPFILTQ